MAEKWPYQSHPSVASLDQPSCFSPSNIQQPNPVFLTNINIGILLLYCCYSNT